MNISSFISSIRRTRLDNGLTLLTHHQPGSGVVAVLTWVKAGYFHEPDEVAGMAHLFEHMFFKGSKKFPGAEEIAHNVSLLGGVTNAGTIYDSTSYYFVLPREGFERGVEIQADAIRNPLFDPEELRKECEVVIEESNRKLDNPPAVATERMYATAFTRHRMKRWRIGSNEVLRNINRDHLVDFFQTLYRPENIVVAVAGDVSHDEAAETVAREFGRIPRGTLEKKRGPSEPPQEAFRFSESRGDIAQSFTVWGWHTPGEGSDEEEAFELLATILGGGRYSRLFRGVVGPGKAASVSAGNSVFEDVGIFTIRASCDDPNLRHVDGAIADQIAAIVRHGVSDYELALARNKIEAAFAFELQEVLGQAQTLAFFESRGGYERIQRHLEALERIRSADLKHLAATYFRPDNLTIHHYRPTGVQESSHEEVLQRAVRGAGVTVSPEHHPLPAAAPPPRSAGSSMPPRRFVLSNGATLLVQERHETPTVSASACFRGGRTEEHSRCAGITQLMARAMRRGTTSRSHEEINREVEFFGTQIGISIDDDYFAFSFDVLQKYFVPVLDVFADVLLHPAFPEEGIGEEQSLQLAAIKRSLDSSSERPFQLFNEAMYGTHPYALPAAGFPGTVERFGRTELREWYESHVVADAALFVVVGDVDADEVRRLFEEKLRALPKSRELRTPLPPFQPPSTRREVVEYRDRKQSAIVMGFPTVPVHHTDVTALRVLGSVTSGLAGTFFAELRGKRSLAYTVYAGGASHESAGCFVAYIASDAAKEREALEGLLREVRRLSQDGISETDLERAKAYIAGTTRIRLQTNSAVAGEIGSHSMLGLGFDYTEHFLEHVQRLTLRDLRDVADRYLNRENYVAAIIRGKT